MNSDANIAAHLLRTHAPYLLRQLNSCTLFTDTSPVSPT